MVSVRFRPLIGVNFCKLGMTLGLVDNDLVSVPLSGLTSVNMFDGYEGRFIKTSFRPLIGVNFCKLYTKGICSE